ncbi:hypothetical protein PAMP_015549 [Pampus punctatissimus]
MPFNIHAIFLKCCVDEDKHPIGYMFICRTCGGGRPFAITESQIGHESGPKVTTADTIEPKTMLADVGK